MLPHQHIVTAETCFKHFIQVKSQFRGKIQFPFEIFPSFVLPRNTIMLYNALLSNFLSIISQVSAYGRLRTKENFKIKSGRGYLREVVAYKRFQI